MDAKPKRRWYQFSLRTFLVLVTLVCVGFGYWVHWSREWIRQRHEANGKFILVLGEVKRTPPNAPGGLWLFGEDGMPELVCTFRTAERAKQLFPEAVVRPDDNLIWWLQGWRDDSSNTILAH